MSTDSDTPLFEVWVSSPAEAPPGVSSPAEALPAGGTTGFDTSDEVEQHSKPLALAGGAIQASSAEFLKSWNNVKAAMDAVMSASDHVPTSGFGLESVTAKLTVSATGKVAFVGELGGELSFEVVFKRR